MTTYTPTAQRSEVVRSFLNRTYSWMSAGLLLTAGVAYLTASNIDLAFSIMGLTLPLIAVQFGIVLGLSFLADRINSVVAGLLFMLYAGITGLTFSSLLLGYGLATVTTAFLTAAGAFAGMSAVGYFIKQDLSGMGRFFLFALIGLVVSMFVNMFLGNGMFDLMISSVGVLLFAGLTVYDTQKLKEMALAGIEGEAAERAAVHGALALYLDFINLFLFILRLLGGNRD